MSIKTAKLLDPEIPGLRLRVRLRQSTVKEEAIRYGVAVETIRKAVRGDTFGHIREGLENIEPPPATPVIDPTDAEIEASLARLHHLREDTPTGDGALDEYLATHKPNPKDPS